MRQSIERVADLYARNIYCAAYGLLDEGEICLLPAQGYQGEILVDEAALNAEPFFSLDEWLEK